MEATAIKIVKSISRPKSEKKMHRISRSCGQPSCASESDEVKHTNELSDVDAGTAQA